MSAVTCPICSKPVPSFYINTHLDSGCQSAQPTASTSSSTPSTSKRKSSTTSSDPPHANSTPPSSYKGKTRKRNDEYDIIVDEATSNSKSGSASGSTRKKFKTSDALEEAKPLAERVRPSRLDDFVGQEELVGHGTMLRSLIEDDRLGSCLFWGPPGTGKTTIARVIAQTTSSVFKELSATNASTAELRKVFEDATNVLKLTGRKTLVFIDEIQRFNKAQQDIFLPVVESGLISLIASTTENPSFRVNNALLSRCRVFVLKKLTPDDIYRILRRALRIVNDSDQDQPPTSSIEPIDENLLRFLSAAADGDARVGLSSLELALSSTKSNPNLSRDELKAQLRRAHLQYDRSGDAHYDTISAMHKAVRGSNPDAALWYLAKMLESGDDPLYIARRMIRMAAEDIGLANPTALTAAVSAYQATQLIGMPECDVILAQVVVMLAESEKSVRVYQGYNEAKRTLKEGENWPVPMHIRNAPTGLMKSLGYGRDYKYEPSYAHPVHQPFLPSELQGRRFLLPEGSLEGKRYDEAALREWEWKQQGGKPWVGREEMMNRLKEQEQEQEGGSGG